MFLRTSFLANSLFILSILTYCGSAAAASRPCLDCHRKLFSKEDVHPAVAQFTRMEQGCPSCHSAPHGKNKATKSLLTPLPDLCFQCHDKARFTKANIHPPVAAGDCLACHNPHASDNQHLLHKPLPYLCMDCHVDRKDGVHILGGYSLGDHHPVHGRRDPSRTGRELSCTSCHDPHSSGQKYLFTDRSANLPNLCSLCHTRITVKP